MIEIPYFATRLNNTHLEKNMKTLILFALVSVLPSPSAFATIDQNAETAARQRCVGFTIGEEPASCVVAFFPARVGAHAYFACGEEVYECVCTANGPSCRKE